MQSCNTRSDMTGEMNRYVVAIIASESLILLFAAMIASVAAFPVESAAATVVPALVAYAASL